MDERLGEIFFHLCPRDPETFRDLLERHAVAPTQHQREMRAGRDCLQAAIDDLEGLLRRDLGGRIDFRHRRELERHLRRRRELRSMRLLQSVLLKNVAGGGVEVGLGIADALVVLQTQQAEETSCIRSGASAAALRSRAAR